jgi:hypothetical protein
MSKSIVFINSKIRVGIDSVAMAPYTVDDIVIGNASEFLARMNDMHA